MIVIIHYSEIALKGKNRKYFENLLIQNIKMALHNIDIKITNLGGRFILEFKNNVNQIFIEEKLKKVFGIQYFSFGQIIPKDLALLKNKILNIIQNQQFNSFKIDARRVFKSDTLSSKQVNEELGAFIKDKLNKKVDLENPDLCCYVELLSRKALVYFNKIKGPGGLPNGCAGKILMLISGGIDSPVAAYKLMKRGAKLIFIHFHNYPATPLASQEKVKQLISILNEYQYGSKIYMIPFLEIQQKLVKKIPQRFLVIFYRRIMLKIADIIAKKEKCLALGTGEALSQVASQTLNNINVISEAIKLPIFRPLIGDDKEETIKFAKQINTFNISIKPYEDCCTFYVPQHPETRANLKKILEIEKKLKIKSLLARAIKNATINTI